MIRVLGVSTTILALLDSTVRSLTWSTNLFIYVSLAQVLFLAALVFQERNDLKDGGQFNFLFETKIPTDLLAKSPPQQMSPTRGFTFGTIDRRDDSGDEEGSYEDLSESVEESTEDDLDPSCCIFHSIRSVGSGLVGMCASLLKYVSELPTVFAIRLWIKKAPNIKHIFCLGVCEALVGLASLISPTTITPLLNIILPITVPLVSLGCYTQSPTYSLRLTRAKSSSRRRRRNPSWSSKRLRADSLPSDIFDQALHSPASFLSIIACNAASACLLPHSPFFPSSSSKLPSLLPTVLPGSPLALPLFADEAAALREFVSARILSNSFGYYLGMIGLSVISTYALCARDLLASRYRADQLTMSWGDPRSLVTTVREVLPPLKGRGDSKKRAPPRVHFTQKEQQLSLSLLSFACCASSFVVYILTHLTFVHLFSPSSPPGLIASLTNLGPDGNLAMSCLASLSSSQLCLVELSSCFGLLFGHFLLALIGTEIVRRSWGCLGLSVMLPLWQHLSLSSSYAEPKSLVGLSLSAIGATIFAVRYSLHPPSPSIKGSPRPDKSDRCCVVLEDAAPSAFSAILSAVP